MEVKGPLRDRETLEHGDVRLHEERGGPSRGRVFFHLAGIGLGFLLLLIGVGLGLSRDMWDKLALVPTIAGDASVATTRGTPAPAMAPAVWPAPVATSSARLASAHHEASVSRSAPSRWTALSR